MIPEKVKNFIIVIIATVVTIDRLGKLVVDILLAQSRQILQFSSLFLSGFPGFGSLSSFLFSFLWEENRKRFKGLAKKERKILSSVGSLFL